MWRGDFPRSARRYSYGSCPARCASSSMKVSTMNAFWDEPDGAPEADRHPDVLVDPLDPHVGDVVRQVPEPGHRRVVDLAGGDRAPLAQEPGPHRAREPRGRLAAGVERRPEHVVRARTVEAVREVVLARPDDLHRPAADRLGDLDARRRRSRSAPAARTRRRGSVVLTVTRSTGSPVSSRGDLARAARVLRRRPHRARVGRHVGRRVHRLHARVLEVRAPGRRPRTSSPPRGQRGGRVAVVPRHETRLPDGGLVLLRDARARELARAGPRPTRP